VRNRGNHKTAHEDGEGELIALRNVIEALSQKYRSSESAYRRHRFPASIIQHAIWLYLRFTLSYRDVEDLLAERGLDISYKTVRRWVLKICPLIARKRRQHRPRPSDRWHLDEMVVRIAGRRMYLWRAVDHEGEILDMLVQRAARQTCSAAVDAQAAQETRLRVEVAVNRQVVLLRLGIPATSADLPSSAGSQKQQSGEELASGGATTRAQDATVQIGESLTWVRIGWVLSRENTTPGTPTLCFEWKAAWPGAPARAPGRPGGRHSPRLWLTASEEPLRRTRWRSCNSSNLI
jgi:hypothetical protein